MKFISWNVNGLRACNRENRFVEYVKQEQPDYICLQETKVSDRTQAGFELEGYYDYWNYSKKKKGYSGTVVFTKKKPLNVKFGINGVDTEGRIITVEFDKFYLVNCYAPNTQMNTSRLNYRLDWNDVFNPYIEKLNNSKDVILCGDINVAHKDIDVCEKYRDRKRTMFTPEERLGFEELLDIGLVDSFRYLHPDEEKFSWWFRNRDDEEFVGWRLDYFLVSNELRENILKSEVCTEVEGSDHCPVKLELKD